MSVLKVGNNCCACKCCQNVCKFGAISFEKDHYGFEQVCIDSKNCVNCGMCEKVCPQIITAEFFAPIKCGWAYAVDEQEKFNGSSGGLFGVLAKHILKKGGVVFGAGFDADLKLKTAKAENFSQLTPLYKSKYLLCDTGKSFSEMKKCLDSGQTVLYCSSPCQISALKLYLGENYDNLLTVEFVCHGVSSQFLFDKSVDYVQSKKHIKITDFRFREKGKNQSSYYYSYKYISNGRQREKSGLYLSFPFYNAYCKEIVYREGCYSCKYANEKRCADITIGDFHNIGKYESEIDRFAGVSMFVINTQNGLVYWNEISPFIRKKDFDLEVIYNNNRFCTDGKVPDLRRQFFERLVNKGFKSAVLRYLLPVRDIKRIVNYNMPKFIRNAVIKLRGVK